MANYTGRLTQQAAVQNFLGINSKSSIVAGRTGEAVDIDNWDIDLSGAITSRLGYVIKSSFINDIRFIDTFFTTEGVQVYIVVSGGNLWEAPAITGPWANRGGTLTTGDYTYVGTSLNGRYMLCNGVDEPIIFTPGQTVDTLKNASLLDPPLSLIGIATGVGSTTYKYVVTSLTPRGESLPSNVATIFNGYATLDATHYITLSWAPRAGAYAQNVYRWNSSTSNYDFVAILTGTSNSYVDNSTTSVTSVHPPTARRKPVIGEGKNGVVRDELSIRGRPNLEDVAMRGEILRLTRGNAYRRDLLLPLLLGEPRNRITGTFRVNAHALKVSRESILGRSGNQRKPIQALLPLPPSPHVDVYSGIIKCL